MDRICGPQAKRGSKLVNLLRVTNQRIRYKQPFTHHITGHFIRCVRFDDRLDLAIVRSLAPLDTRIALPSDQSASYPFVFHTFRASF